MRPGKLRHRVTIQKKVVTQDSYGEEVITWTDVATLWAKIEPLRGREYLEGRQEQADVTVRVVTRYYPGVQPSMRLTHGSRVFEIVTPINVDEFDEVLELMCREEINA